MNKFCHHGFVWSMSDGVVFGQDIRDSRRKCYILPEWAVGELRALIRRNFGV